MIHCFYITILLIHLIFIILIFTLLLLILILFWRIIYQSIKIKQLYEKDSMDHIICKNMDNMIQEEGKRSERNLVVTMTSDTLT